MNNTIMRTIDQASEKIRDYVNRETIAQIESQVKQAMIDESFGELVNQFQFKQGDDLFKVIAQLGTYSILLDCKRQRLIVAWALKPFDDGTGTWGQGYYFDGDHNAETIELRFNTYDVAKLFAEKTGLIK